MKDKQRAEEIAVNRHKIIAPYVAAMDGNADAALLGLLKVEACMQNGIHRRTFERWLCAYLTHGFEGLKPTGR